jgi:hypothetical protein
MWSFVANRKNKQWVGQRIRYRDKRNGVGKLIDEV